MMKNLPSGLQQYRIDLPVGTAITVLPANPRRRGMILQGAVTGGGFWMSLDGVDPSQERGIFISGGSTLPIIFLPELVGTAITGPIKVITTLPNVVFNCVEFLAPT